MAEEEGQEKTHQPTQRRLQKAKEEGQVPRSRELTTALSMIAVAIILWASGKFMFNGFLQMMVNFFSPNTEVLMDMNAMGIFVAEQALGIVQRLIPLFLTLFCIALAAPIALGGFNFSSKALGFKSNRISPLSGFKRMFSVKSVMELLKALAKFFLILSVGVLTIYFQFSQYIHLTDLPLIKGISIGFKLLIVVFFLISISLLLIAAIDVPFQLWQHHKKLKMTHREIRDELKETDGNPEVKSKRRHKHMAVQEQRRSLEKVPAADVILVNPTDYAVALKYDQNVDAAPVVISKGQDEIAHEIRRIAKEHNITIFSAPPLTRAIFYNTKINQTIPYGLYVAVAKVLSFVYQLKKYQAGFATKPSEHLELPIPDELKHD